MNLSKLVFVFMNGTRLAGAWKSKTTRKQYLVVLATCVALAAAGLVFPEYANDATAAGVIAGVIPLIRRYVQYKPKPVSERKKPSEEETVLELPTIPPHTDPRWETEAIKVRWNHDKNLWTACITANKTFLAASVNGWDFAIDPDGNEWNIHTLEKTGRTIRLPKPAPVGAVTALKKRLAEIKNKAGE